MAGQRGVSLVEALVSFLVVSVGMLALVRVQGELRLGADAARQRSEAVRLAQRDMEALRAADGAPAASTHDVQAGNATYKVERGTQAQPSWQIAQVQVSWRDRRGQAQQVRLQAVVSPESPLLAAALAQPLAPDGAALGPLGRSVHVPVGATPLNGGRRLFKPGGAGAIVWIHDNASGAVTATCSTATTAATATAGAGAGASAGAGVDVGAGAPQSSACQPAQALTVSGIVRFSGRVPPDAGVANDTPLPLSMDLALDTADPLGLARCHSEAVRVVRIQGSGGASRLERKALAEPLDAAAADTGERFVAYSCLVPTVTRSTLPTPHWSGRLRVLAQGFSIGLTAQDWRVCRYSADTDRSGAIDRPAEHPERHVDVTVPLRQQNFLVVRGDQACPAAAALSAATNTAPHQP